MSYCGVPCASLCLQLKLIKCSERVLGSCQMHSDRCTGVNVHPKNQLLPSSNLPPFYRLWVQMRSNLLCYLRPQSILCEFAPECLYKRRVMEVVMWRMKNGAWEISSYPAYFLTSSQQADHCTQWELLSNCQFQKVTKIDKDPNSDSGKQKGSAIWQTLWFKHTDTFSMLTYMLISNSNCWVSLNNTIKSTV